MDGADNVTLDWESLGELVRQRTLELVATHFAGLASLSTADVDGSADAASE